MKFLTLIASVAFAFVAQANEPATPPAAPTEPATAAVPAEHKDMTKKDKKHHGKKGHKKEEASH